MTEKEKTWKFAHKWLEAWNKHDVDLIMKHYADSIEFCSPVVQKVLGDPRHRVLAEQRRIIEHSSDLCREKTE